MKLSKKLLCALLSAVIVASASAIPASAAIKDTPDYSGRDFAEGEAIVVLKDNASSAYSAKSESENVYGNGIKLKKKFTIDANGGDSVKMTVLKSSKMTTEQLVASVRKKSGVKYAFPNYRKKISSITNDTYSKFQWALDNTGQNGGTAGADINAESLWEKAEAAENDTVVAVIDTGIDFEHEDLKDVIWTNPYGSKLIGKHGYDFTETYANGKPKDDNGHGSHVAGIIAGVGDNEKGISGVNKTKVKIMSIKAFDAEGYGYEDDELAAFDYISRAVKLGVNVKAVNCSYGGAGDDEAKKTYEEIFDELGKSGIVTVVAACNEEQNLSELDPDMYFDEFSILPAMCESRYCVTVAASDENDKLALFSNYSPEYVDVAAPGVDILSSVSYDTFNPSIYDDAQKNELVKDLQDYDSEVKAGDLGYPVVTDKTSKRFDLFSNAEVLQTNTHFGDEGKSISVKFNEGIDALTDELSYYLIEIPYTLENENDPYRVSFMASAVGTKSFGAIVDVPADFNVYDTGYYTEVNYLSAYEGCWHHTEITIDPKKTYNYKKSTDRKLQIYYQAEEGDSLIIDDFAVSKQGAEESKFGKYDFYSGTSMATPHVTGAIALANNACEGASVNDLINMVCNTGRVSADLQDKVRGARSLSLDNTDKVPPIISAVEYASDNKNIEIKGTMNNVSTVKVNGEEVTPVSVAEDKVVISDNNYNTTKLEVALTNEYGTDNYKTFISNKPNFPATKKVVGSPDSTNNMFTINTGKEAYFVSEFGTIEKLSYNIASDKYKYTTVGYIDTNKLMSKEVTGFITAAEYYKGKIYFTVVGSVQSSSYVTLGYESVLGCYDLKKKTTELVCESPDIPIEGAALAAYGNGLYVIGGFDYDEMAPTDSVFKYDSKENCFKKLDTKLPEGRAFAEFISYNGKLVGMYGMSPDEKMPSPIVFDGKSWTKSAQTFDSNDKVLFTKDDDDKEYYRYYGNVGVGEKGVFCNGAYVYGVGDTFTYNPDSDTVKASKYSSTNSLSDKKLFGTTLPGCFIGFEADDEISYSDDDDDDDFFFSKTKSDDPAEAYDSVITPDDLDKLIDDLDDGYESRAVYLLKLKNTDSDPEKQTYIKLKKTSASLYVKGTYKIKPSIRNIKGKTTYKSSNKKVAKVSSSGKITALRKGTAKITVKNNGATAVFKVTVKNPKLNAASKTLSRGQSFKITVKGKVGKTKFSSSNTKVASVSSGGTVTAKSKGSATITVKTNGMKLRCKITVK